VGDAAKSIAVGEEEIHHRGHRVHGEREGKKKERNSRSLTSFGMTVFETNVMTILRQKLRKLWMDGAGVHVVFNWA
jgi:hypothetical protein